MGAALIPLATAAIGSAVAAPAAASILGETALAASLATGLNEAGLALGLPSSMAVTQQGLASGIGSLIGGGAGTALGSQLAKDFIPEGGPVGHPGMASFPNSRGIQAPQFQFQTVGIQPSATIGGRQKDILDLLRQYQRAQRA